MARLTLRCLTTALLSVILYSVSHAQETPRALLNELSGRWTMSGRVMGEPVRYNAEGRWELGGAFLSLHMKDAAVPPQYEATVYMGMDSAAGEFVGHWLDTFGGAGARVTALGPFSNSVIELIYPYTPSRFRNRFTWSPASRTWELLIESETPSGTWNEFARYTLKKR